jgi:hypothetical protein
MLLRWGTVLSLTQARRFQRRVVREMKHKRDRATKNRLREKCGWGDRYEVRKRRLENMSVRII